MSCGSFFESIQIHFPSPNKYLSVRAFECFVKPDNSQQRWLRATWKVSGKRAPFRGRWTLACSHVGLAVGSGGEQVALIPKKTRGNSGPASLAVSDIQLYTLRSLIRL